MKEAVKLAVALGFTCAVASGVLALANHKTRAPIEIAERRQLEGALSLVLPEFDNQPAAEKVVVGTDSDQFTFFPARQNGAAVAVAAQGATNQGFGGNLQVLVGIEQSGAVRAVIVTAHKETPGLGTQATSRQELKSFWALFKGSCAAKQCDAPAAKALAPCPYLDQFHLKKLAADGAPFKLAADGGQLDAVSGATVTSRAVAHAVSRVCAALEQNRAAVFAAAEQTPSGVDE